MMKQDSSARRVAVVTGAGGGVGAATAQMLARQGHDLVLNVHRRVEALKAVQETCTAAGADVAVVQGDLADDAVCREIAKTAVERYGRIDAVVHAAGATRFVPINDLEGVSAQDFHDLFGVNAVSAFQMARAAAPHMVPGAAIVFISTTSTLTGNGSSLPYVAAKAALNALTVGLARALAPKARVNAVLPGMIEGRWITDRLGEAAYARSRNQVADASLLGRVATPEDIARAIGWLLDSECLMTGQLMVVDGGFLHGKPPPPLDSA
jgi:3-oxoacyl-[acyl-carrier protein] reductase